MHTPLVPVLVAGALAMLAGAFFWWRGWLIRRADSGFVGRSVATTAEVTDLRLLDTNSWDGERETVWFPVVRFALPDGRVVEAQTVYGADPAPTRPGRTEPVRYDPDDPTRVMLARGGTRPGTLGVMFTVLGVAGILVGLLAVGTWVLFVLVLRVPA
ncbi:MAG: DUF3592 domain-containing protein [Nocardioides sp.]